MLKLDVAPRPSTLSTQMRPPCASTMRLTIASPSPMLFSPPVGRTLVLPNSVNILGSSEAGIPCPWSCTAIATSSPITRAHNVMTVLGKEYLIALAMRLLSTWLIRSGSITTCGKSGARSNANSLDLALARIALVVWHYSR